MGHTGAGTHLILHTILLAPGRVGTGANKTLTSQFKEKICLWVLNDAPRRDAQVL